MPFRDITLPELTDKDVGRALTLKTEQNQIIVAIAGAIAQALWFAVDYVLLPNQHLFIISLRAAILIITLLLCIFRKQLRIGASFCLFVTAVCISFIIALILNSHSQIVFGTYVIAYCILFLGAGALANWRRIYSVLFLSISLALNIVFYWLFSPIPFNIFIAEGLFPIFSVGLVGMLMIENRRNIHIKEIRARMEIERSKKIIEAQRNKLNNELDNFVYSVSHDLRSPLLSVKGILTLLFDTGKIDPSAEQYLRMAETSINRLDNTIQDILEYSRNSRMDVQHEWFDMAQVVQQIFDDIQFISETPIQFEMNIEGNATIFSDKTRIATIVKNLASNGAKYRKLNASDSYVKFHMRQYQEQLQITVSDNGIGIPPEQRENVFKMFYRVSTDRVGTGLGLFIVQEVTRKLNGRVALESEVEKGTSITVYLPIVKDNSNALSA
jgi:signal transduction histidine kinase